jgi:hypothetical protein
LFDERVVVRMEEEMGRIIDAVGALEEVMMGGRRLRKRLDVMARWLTENMVARE